MDEHKPELRRRRRAVGPRDGTPPAPEPRPDPAPEPTDDIERFVAERPPHHDRER